MQRRFPRTQSRKKFDVVFPVVSPTSIGAQALAMQDRGVISLLRTYIGDSLPE